MKLSFTFSFFALSQVAAGLLGLGDPKIELDYATFQGKNDLLTGTSSFLGMPFAKANRLENPRLIRPGDIDPGKVQDATR